MCWRMVREAEARFAARFSRWPFVYYVLPLLAWMGAIYALSAQSSLPSAPDAWWDLLLKKGAHMAGYAVLTVLWWRVLRRRQAAGWALALSTLFALAYAISDEVHQLYVPGRNGRVWDMAIDACGVLLAAAVLWHRSRRE